MLFSTRLLSVLEYVLQSSDFKWCLQQDHKKQLYTPNVFVALKAPWKILFETFLCLETTSFK